MGRTRNVVAAAVIALSLAGCGTTPAPTLTGGPPAVSPAPTLTGASVAGSPAPTQLPVRPFDIGGIHGQMSVTWRTASFDTMSIAHSTVIAYISTEPLSNPCSRLAPSPCPQHPVAALGPDGVLITWTEYGLGGQSLDWSSGDPATIGGRPFRVRAMQADAACAAIGGEHTVVARSPKGQQDFTEMNACYRGPDTEVVRARVQAMLDSITWQ